MENDTLSRQLDKDLLPRLKGEIGVIGIGNPWRADDGIGPMIIHRLKGKIRAKVYDCGAAPENYLGKIIADKPDTLIIIDSAVMNQTPGTIKILKVNEIGQSGMSTHNSSLKLFIDYLGKAGEFNVFVLAVQPKSLEFGEKVSEEVKKSVKKIEKLFLQKLALERS